MSDAYTTLEGKHLDFISVDQHTECFSSKALFKIH